jgi:cytochrome c oxidase cbb3-type subunit 3
MARGRRIALLLTTLAAWGLAGCNRSAESAAVPAASAPAPATPSTIATLPPPEDGYGNYYARPEALAAIATNDIAKSMRANATALRLGEAVYAKNCAACHGADLKGVPGQHAPDLTDAAWKFAGDDLESGGATHYPADVEWTVRYGIRSGHPDTLGVEADMPALDPDYRSPEDTKEYGSTRFLSNEEIGDVVEYVLKISGQENDAARAARGDVLFHDGLKGNCNDCHTDEGTGNLAIGSADLTRKELFLYGSDRASILESVTRGRRGTMPAFEGALGDAEIKAVAVFVFSRAAK